MKYKMKLFAIRGVFLILLLSLLSFGMPFAVCGAAVNDTVIGDLTLDATYAGIGVISSFSGDDNGNNHATLYYRITGEPGWTAGIDMTVDRRDNLQIASGEIANTYKNQWRAVIYGVAANTSYDVKVEYTDADGISGTAEGTAVTLNDNPPSSGDTYYVATTGDDTSGDGTFENPWETISKAAAMVSAGDTVNIMPGTYNEQVILSASGAPDNYITFQSNDSDDKATVTYGSRQGTFKLLNISYNRIKDLDIITTADDGQAVRIDSDSIGNIIEDCSITVSGLNWWCAAIFLYGESAGSGPSYTLIQNNTLTCTVEGNDGPFGIMQDQTDGGTVIRWNTITGGFFDGIAASPNFGIDGPNRNYYIYENTVSDSSDDGIESEGAGLNVAIWGNTVTGCGNFELATCPVIIGPTYVFRNVCTSSQLNGAMVKLGHAGGRISDGSIYYYNNTFYQTIQSQGVAYYGSSNQVKNVYFFNNIIEMHTYNYVIEEGVGSLGLVSYDYNSVYSTHPLPVKWLGTTYSYANWRTNFGQEAHGLWGQAEVISSSDMHLQADSPCIDKGVVLTGFNDANSPWPYSGSAPDIGACEYDAVETIPPELDSIGDKSVDENAELTFTISATDPDSDQLTYSASNLPSGATFTPSTRMFLWTPSYSQAGTYNNVSFTVSDGQLTDSEDITITVNNVDVAPELDSIGDKSAHPDMLLTFTVSATDPDGTVLTYSAGNLPSGASFNGTTGVFAWTPGDDQTGSYPDVHFEASDGALTDSEDITITVTLNQSPVLTNPDNRSVNENAELTFTISATDPDSDQLTYSASNLPSGATFTPSTRTFLWTPSYSQAGTYNNVSFTVSDGQLTDSENITITVNNVNRAPELVFIGDKSVTEGQLLTFTISATDPDSDQLTYSAGNLPSGASFNGTTGVFAWTSGDDGSYPDVHFEVSDGDLTDSEDITVTVDALPLLPSGGGGGGGGGVGTSSITSLLGCIDADGCLIEDVTASDINLKVKLCIPSGTIVRNRIGQRVTSILISQLGESQDANSGSKILGRSYEIGPSGATFEEMASIMFRYSSLAIPDGVPESNLYIALWDPDAMVWTDLGGTIDMDACTVTAPISHLSTYALMAHTRPADFTMSELTLASGEVILGDTIMASIVVSNQGDLSGDYTVSLNLDDATIQSKEITLTGGSSETVRFDIVPDIIGEYQVSIGDMLATFTVKEPLSPAVFTVSDLTVNPLLPYSGDNIDVNVLVKNTGDLSGIYQATLALDDIAVDAKDIMLDGSGSQVISFSFTSDTIGQHKVSVGDLVAPFEVRSSLPLLPPPAEDPEINSFSAAAGFDPATNKLVYTRIVYKMNQDWDSIAPENSLMLSVFYDGEFLEQVPLLTLSQLQADGKTGELEYIPSAGWQVGEYTFQAALYQGDNLIRDTSSQRLTVTSESTTAVVSWKTMGILIGSVFVLGAIVLALVLYFRRDMFRDYRR